MTLSAPIGIVEPIERSPGASYAPPEPPSAEPPSAERRAPSAEHRAPPGFTLIEMMVVITVIAVLAALVSPMVFRNVGDAKRSAAEAQIEILGLALDAYRLDNDYYPSTGQGLDALSRLPAGEPPARNWRGPYLKKAVPLDPWERPYVFRSPGDSSTSGYDLFTLGRDGAPGGDGEDADITSWSAR